MISERLENERLAKGRWGPIFPFSAPNTAGGVHRCSPTIGVSPTMTVTTGMQVNRIRRLRKCTVAGPPQRIVCLSARACWAAPGPERYSSFARATVIGYGRTTRLIELGDSATLVPNDTTRGKHLAANTEKAVTHSRATDAPRNTPRMPIYGCFERCGGRCRRRRG
jgi:hypothetical protein